MAKKDTNNSIHPKYKALWQVKERGMEEVFKDDLMSELYHGRLARWGFTHNDIQKLGIDGDLVEQTARLAVISDCLWLFLNNAAILGQVDRWEFLEKRFGYRVGQVVKALTDLKAMVGEANTKVVDYQEIWEEMAANIHRK